MVPTRPLPVIRYTQRDFLYQQLQRVVEQERPEGILLGWPADHLGLSTPQTEVIRQFAERLGGLVGLPVAYHPETLTTQLAQQRMLEAGVSKQKRREVEDSYAAAAILDDYLEQLET